MCAMREIRVGDWVCMSCKNHNFAVRQTCNKCGSPKPAGGMGAFQGKGGMGMGIGMAMSGGCGLPGGMAGVPAAPSSSVRAGDWSCASCGNHNFASRQACNKCGAEREGNERSMPTQTGAGGGAMRPGDWMCPDCNNHNYANREVCNKCQAPRPEVEDGDGSSYGPAATHKGAAASPYGRPAGAGAYVGLEVETGHKPQESVMRDGDWLCPDCDNHNYATRVNCNKCGYLKEGMKEGDWMCHGCKTHNFANKMVCFKCGAPRPPDKKKKGAQQTGGMTMGGMGGMMMGGMGGYGGACFGGKGAMPMAGGGGAKAPHEGDWMCQSCQNHNYATRVKCNRCQNIRPGCKDGDWICKGCKNHNFASRDACKKCGNMKEGDQ